MNSLKLSRRKLVAITIAISLVLTISYPLTQPAKAQQTHNVSIQDFAFQPQILTIQPGDTIIWLNNDPVIYTLWFVYIENKTTCKKIGSEGLSEPILPGETWSWVFDETVKLQYYSFERLWITGFINVTAEAHDVAVTDVVTSKIGCLPIPTVGQGYFMNVTVNVENQGDFEETFNVTVYANTTEVETIRVTLANRTSTILNFTWNTTSFVKGNYTIRAVADTVDGETETADNSKDDGTVLVSIVGDVNGNRKVDVFDAVITINAVPSVPGWPNWNPNADIDCNGKVDVFDAVICIGNIPSGPW